MRASLAAASTSRQALLGSACVACGRRDAAMTLPTFVTVARRQQQRRSAASASWTHPVLGAVVGTARDPSFIATPSKSRRLFSSSASYGLPAPAKEPPPSATADEGSEPATSSGPAASPAPTTYYSLFPATLPHGPPPRGPFVIDVRALRREFLQLQAVAHPDKAGARPPSSTSSSTASSSHDASATLNEAYRTLASPLLRAQYLLRLRGHDVAGAANETGSIASADQELLATVMEARERLEDCETQEEVDAIAMVNDARIREAEEGLARAFAAEEGDEQATEEAKRWAVRLRYWENVRESLHHWEKGGKIVLQH